ncbi:MAG TPA: preprotein translocase subunit SecE [Cyclobacteriaceae bacterium]|nr:preprotein translocase subunit SecE [Cyclobacteriaceae bacterium]
MKKIKDYIIDSYQELRFKVSWPKFKELQNSSVLVLVASIIFALLVGLIDVVFKNIMSWYYNAF